MHNMNTWLNYVVNISLTIMRVFLITARRLKFGDWSPARLDLHWLGFTPCLHRILSRVLRCSIFLMRAHGCRRKLWEVLWWCDPPGVVTLPSKKKPAWRSPRERPCGSLLPLPQTWRAPSTPPRRAATGVPWFGERGGAPKGGRHFTIFVNPRWKLCLSSAHLGSGSLMVWQSTPTSGS